jgi:hypothetical protein
MIVLGGGKDDFPSKVERANRILAAILLYGPLVVIFIALLFGTAYVTVSKLLH